MKPDRQRSEKDVCLNVTPGQGLDIQANETTTKTETNVWAFGGVMRPSVSLSGYTGIKNASRPFIVHIHYAPQGRAWPNI